MYRSRLGTDLNDITLDYVSSINDDSEIAMYDILGSQAHSLMLFQNDIITKNDAKKILNDLMEKNDGLIFLYNLFPLQNHSFDVI